MLLREYEAKQEAKKGRPLRALAFCRTCGKCRPGCSPNKKASPYCLACAMMDNYIATTCKKEAKKMSEPKDYRRKIAQEIIREALDRMPKAPKPPQPQMKLEVRGKPMTKAETEEIKAAARETAKKALARMETKNRLAHDTKRRQDQEAKTLGYYRVNR